MAIKAKGSWRHEPRRGPGLRSLKKANGMSEYIGKDDYFIFNDEEQFNHSLSELSLKLGLIFK